MNPRDATSIDLKIGAELRRRRVALCLSQSKLGERVGVTFQQIQKYETGKNRVSASRLFLIAKELDASVADFLPEQR